MFSKNAIDKSTDGAPIRGRVARRLLHDRVFALTGLVVTAGAFLVLLALLGQLVYDGMGRV